MISETTAQTEQLDFADVIETGPTLRAAFTAVAVCLLATSLLVLDPSSARIAVARLANPFSNVAWPQKTHLALRKPVDRVARGQPFEIEVVDAFGAKLPPEVRILYQFEGPDGGITEETDRMQLLGGVMVARRENVTRPFSYRVEGGDDSSMPWTAVEVVEPPTVESLAIELIPPKYTGWPVEKAQRHLRALVGTRVRMSGRATKPLDKIAVRLDSDRTVPGRLNADRLRFQIPAKAAPKDTASEFVVEKSGAYWFELTDREGLTGGEATRWEIRAIADRPPSVAIEQPAATVFVTPRAVVPLRVSAKDDLAIRRIALVLQPPDGLEETQPDREISLHEGPDQVEPRPGGGLSNTESGENRLIETRWELVDLKLQPGSQLTFLVTASDYRPQTGKSQPRRLVIITPEELADRIAARQTSILAELTRVLKMQRRGRMQLAELHVRLAELGQFDRLDVDHLRGAELNQRQIDHSLTSPTEGVPMHILGLLADLENNKVDSPDVSRRMRALLDQLERLSREHLPPIGRELTTAIKAAQVQLDGAVPTQDATTKPEPKPDGTIAAALAAAGEHQDAVIESLQQMLSQLSRWDDYRRFHREIGQLLRDQQELNRRATELARQTLGKDPRTLRPNESADLKIVTHRQAELARRLDRVLQEMDQTGRRLQDTDPLAAETVADAFNRAVELAVGGKMREAAGQVERNRMGQAVGRQRQIVDDLQEVLDILANRREHELARLIDKLKQAEIDLTQLNHNQEDLRGRLERDSAVTAPEQRAAKLNTLGDEQAGLQDRAERISRRLARLMADRSAKAVTGVAQKMREAAQSATADSGSTACRQATEAGDELAEACRRLAQKRRGAEAELAIEQLAKLQDAVRTIQQQHRAAFEETRRLDRLPPQAAELRTLANRQRTIGTETASLGDKLVGGAAFALALSGAAGDMGLAAGLLDRGRTGGTTQQAQQRADRRLTILLESLLPEEPGAQPDNATSGQGQGQGGKPGGGVRTLAELKLLALLQQEINDRTRQLDQSVDRTKPLSDEVRRTYESLGSEQGSLAELLFELLQPEEK